MSPGELDILEHHFRSQSQLSGQSPAYSDSDFKRYIQSPEGEDAANRAISESLKPGIASSHAEQSNSNQSFSANSTGASLEAALAALGDAGRQQLLAILQLANGNSGGNGSGSSQGAENMSIHSRHASAGSDVPPGAATGQNAKAPAESGRYLQQKSSLEGTSKHHSAQSSPKNSTGQPSPTYFANAFNQYAGGESTRQGGTSRGAPNGGANVQSTYVPPRTVSAGSSTHPSPASALTVAPSTMGVSASPWNGHQSSFRIDIEMLNSLSNGDFASGFPLADASQHRSPALVPGTSSSAFYSESGFGDDNDLLFTPLLSPALTASTQPGPSIGPLPESFANMGGTASVRDMYAIQSKPTQQQDAMGKQTYDMSTNPSQSYLPYSLSESSSAGFAATASEQGISPLHLFSPLSSPAIRPQHEHSSLLRHGQGIPLTASQAPKVTNGQLHGSGNSSRSSNASSKSNGSIKGASRNHPRARPSPIIRPEGSSANHSRLPSSTAPANGHQSQPSSKRNSISNQSQSQQAQAHSRQKASGGSQPAHSRTASLGSAPASPATAFAPSSTYSSFLPPHQRQTQQGFAPSPGHSRRSDTTSIAPGSTASSANMFDGTSITPALAAAFLSGNLAYSQPYAPHNPAAIQQQQQQQQQYLQQQQQQMNAYTHMINSGVGSMSAPPSSALEASGAYSVPSPLDLNSIFGLLGATPSQSSLPSPSQPGAHQMPMQQDGQPRSQFPSPAANTVSSGSGSHEDMLLDDISKQTDLAQDDASGLPLALAQFFKQQSSASTSFSGNLDAQMNGNAGPLTPASFMNLTSNQYDLLAGLIADQSKLIPVGPSAGQYQHMDDNALNTNSQPFSQSQQAAQGGSKAAGEPMREVPQEKASSQAGKPDDINRTSPAFKAVQERAAAALAEKEAKALAKGRGKKRSATGDVVPGSATTIAASSNTSSRKNGKRAAGTDMDLEIIAGLGDRSGNASLETSPNLLPTDTRKSSHKVAEQRRRDSLKLCFEELRFILPPLTMEECDDEFVSGMGKRPGENNVGGQRGKASAVDPKHPNKGVSKVALLRKSNEYVTKLHERIDKRDAAIKTLREELRACRLALGQGVETDEAGLDALSAVDFEELEEDCDNPAPTYKVHGIDIPGGPLSHMYKPSQPSIAEDAKEDESDPEVQHDQEDDEEEYKQRRTKRASTSKATVSTRGSRREKV